MLAMHEVKTMKEIVGDSLQLERTTSLMMSFFALAALLMATLGAYVVSPMPSASAPWRWARAWRSGPWATTCSSWSSATVKLAGAGFVLQRDPVAGGVWLLVGRLEVRGVSWPSMAFSTVIIGCVAVVASSIPAWRRQAVADGRDSRSRGTDVAVGHKWMAASRAQRQRCDVES